MGDARLPQAAPALVREHRLYQADWLMRYYGYNAAELTTDREPNLSLEKDPKLTWAEAHPEFFPVDVNAAPREALLRVPGVGYRNVSRILRIRKYHRLCIDDLRKLNVRVKLAENYLITADHLPRLHQHLALTARKPVQPVQLDLFAGVSAFSGQL
jgi:predicted DNA-binding helix-hairpin-helix protein